MRYGNRDMLSKHTNGEIFYFKLLNYLYLIIMWWKRTQFPNSTFWRLVFSHEWFRIHLQRDEVELEMNSEPRVDSVENLQFYLTWMYAYNLWCVRPEMALCLKYIVCCVLPELTMFKSICIYILPELNVCLKHIDLCCMSRKHTTWTGCRDSFPLHRAYCHQITSSLITLCYQVAWQETYYCWYIISHCW